MRLKQYYKMWSTLYELEDIELSLNETINLKTIVKKKGNEYYFWVDKDLYIVRVMKKDNSDSSHYELSFVYKDIENQEETSSLTKKNQPFRVMDGVVTTMKMFIKEKKPKVIEFNVYGNEKKTKMFERIINLVVRKYKSIFGMYSIKRSKTKLNLPYDMPDDIDDIIGIKILMKRKKY